MTNKNNCKISYDPTTLMGLSDHVFLKTTVTMSYLPNLSSRKNNPNTEDTIYKWIEGT